jgi:lipopolysaccharide export system permease protein
VKIVHRLYLADFFKLLLLIACGMSLLASLIDLIGNIDDFLPSKPAIGSLVLYAVLNFPKFFLYLLPMSVLICSLFTLSQAVRRKEIVAIKAAGGRLRNLSWPFVICGVLISIAAFCISEVVAPDFSTRAGELRTKLEGKGKKTAFSEGALWIKDRKGNPVRIELYVPEEKAARGITIFVQGETFLQKMITAKKAAWNEGRWVLEKVSIVTTETGKSEELARMDYYDLDSPDIFSREMKTSDEMGLAELYRYIQRLKAVGFNNIKLLVDLNAKVSFPLINMFMMLLGISLASRSTTGGGLYAAGMGLAISLLYWFGYTFSLSVGYAGIVPPFIAAWTVSFIFGSFSVYLFATVPE